MDYNTLLIPSTCPPGSPFSGLPGGFAFSLAEKKPLHSALAVLILLIALPTGALADTQVPGPLCSGVR